MLGRLFTTAFMAAATPVAAAQFTMDTLLRSEAVTKTVIDPTGRWAVIERRLPYGELSSFGDSAVNEIAAARLLIADLDEGGPARPLFQTAYGVVAIEFSPDGEHLLVFRHRDGDTEAGVIHVQTGEAMWTGRTLEPPVWGRTTLWLSNDRLLLLARPKGSVHPRFRQQGLEEALPRLWKATRSGTTPSVTVSGSGRFRDAGESEPDLALVDIQLSSGVQTEVASGRFVDMEASRAGGHVALISTEERLQPSAEEDLSSNSNASRGRLLRILDIATSQLTSPCPGMDVSTHLLSWSARGELLIHGRRRGQEWSDASYAVVAPGERCRSFDMGEWRADRVSIGPRLAGPSAAWMGDIPIVNGSDSQGRRRWLRLDKNGPSILIDRDDVSMRPIAVGDETVTFAVGDGLTTVHASGRVDHAIGTALPRPSSLNVAGGDRLRGSPPRGEAIVARSTRGASILGSRSRPCTSELCRHARLVAAAEDRMIWHERQSNGVERLVSDVGGRQVELTKFNAHLANVELSHPRPVKHVGPGGQPLTSWLYLPPTALAAARLPLVVIGYPGSVHPTPPDDQAGASIVFTPRVQLLTGAGYAVLVPSVPRKAMSGEPGAGLADQYLAAADAAAAQWPVDTERMALWGQSFGGYGALIAASQTSRFKAVIAQAAASDLSASWGAVNPLDRWLPTPEGALYRAGWVERGQAGMGVPPWADQQRYDRNSPLSRAGSITSPVLLVHGDQDQVPAWGAEAMFTALRRQNRDAKLLMFWGEGHLIDSPANARFLHRSIIEWLETFIGPPR